MPEKNSSTNADKHPGIAMGTAGGYVAVHLRARKTMAASCEQCGATEHLQAALRPGTPAERLRVNPKTGVLYSTDVADYHALCAPCHCHLDSRTRHGQPENHCKNGHELTPENTYTPPGTGSRVCRACKRKYATDRLKNPVHAEENRRRSREWKRNRTANRQRSA